MSNKHSEIVHLSEDAGRHLSLPIEPEWLDQNNFLTRAPHAELPFVGHRAGDHHARIKLAYTGMIVNQVNGHFFPVEFTRPGIIQHGFIDTRYVWNGHRPAFSFDQGLPAVAIIEEQRLEVYAQDHLMVNVFGLSAARVDGKELLGRWRPHIQDDGTVRWLCVKTVFGKGPGKDRPGGGVPAYQNHFRNVVLGRTMSIVAPTLLGLPPGMAKAKSTDTLKRVQQLGRYLVRKHIPFLRQSYEHNWIGKRYSYLDKIPVTDGQVTMFRQFEKLCFELPEPGSAGALTWGETVLDLVTRMMAEIQYCAGVSPEHKHHPESIFLAAHHSDPNTPLIMERWSYGYRDDVTTSKNHYITKPLFGELADQEDAVDRFDLTDEEFTRLYDIFPMGNLGVIN